MGIKIFTTGGSIDKIYSTKHSTLVIGEPQAGKILDEAKASVHCQIESILKKDSLDIAAADRQRIVEKVKAAPQRMIVLTHGTDTMIETAKALSGIPGKVIVLTGAMQPAAFRETDAAFNVASAVIAVQTLPEGVYIVMGGQVFDPDKARKNLEQNRFEHN